MFRGSGKMQWRSRKRPCNFFKQQGGCRFGQNCKFSHDDSMSTVSTSRFQRTIEPQNLESTTLDKNFGRWKSLLRFSGDSFMAQYKLQEFFGLTYELVSGNDPGILQAVIKRLADEEGLEMIKLLAEAIPLRGSDTSSRFFVNTLRPLLRSIAFPDVQSSLVLESSVDNICIFLYGSSGRRATPLLGNAVDGLSYLAQLSLEQETDLLLPALQATLTTLSRILTVNEAAKLSDQIKALVQELSPLIEKDEASLNTRAAFSKIQMRLGIGAPLEAPKQKSERTTALPKFSFIADQPGHLAEGGQRHDNDHADISDIRILPTTEEIASERAEYLPGIGSATRLTGYAGVLDRQFRLLREDCIGPLRDAIKVEAENLGNHSQQLRRDYSAVQHTVHRNAIIECARVDDFGGVQIVVSFIQPSQAFDHSAQQREEFWKTTRRLQADALVCLVAAQGMTIFAAVYRPLEKKTRADKSMDGLIGDEKRASISLSLLDAKPPELKWICGQIRNGGRYPQSLVEFPGVLLASFKPTLQALQQMSTSLDLPFEPLLASPSGADVGLIRPPAYTRTRRFSFDLSPLQTNEENLTLEPGQAFDFEKFSEMTTLDSAQQRAVIEALSREVALIQGPPGTGKSYTGVSILKVLLKAQKPAELGPIICVCYTNHALDQLLEHLVEDGVENIIRIGSRSKSELLQNLTLRHVASKMERTRTEISDIGFNFKLLKRTVMDLGESLELLDPKSKTKTLVAYIEEHYPRIHRDIHESQIDSEGFQTVRHGRDPFTSWLYGGKKGSSKPRPVSELLQENAHALTSAERLKLMGFWKNESSRECDNNIAKLAAEFQATSSSLKICKQEADLRCLYQASIIGVTTSGLARNLDLLRRVRSKVVLCEEAGEVLEAHMLTAMLPSIEHAILIGDHEQLRPQIANYELSSENPRGKKYSLDVSLFERLVRGQGNRSEDEQPQENSTCLPFSTLETQRRMHPSISELIRSIYPNLEDHPTVSEYPEVVGMRKRLFWLDHNIPEDGNDLDGGVSKTNSYEVEIVASLVSHLMWQGHYRKGEIAVITPYLGQLQNLRRRLAGIFTIQVDDRDLEDLEVQGLGQETEPSENAQTGIHKIQSLEAVRVATVDNFQGEEAKVVIVSLVRSNAARKCGFLRTSNRINVLLSRAKHGMYLIGNSETASSVPMWSGIVSHLGAEGNLGEKIELCCPRHPEKQIAVSTPDEFNLNSPNGGCEQKCGKRLSCGHVCPTMCHSQPLHESFMCVEACRRPQKGCSHSCPKPCGQACPPKCTTIVENIKLPCGHVAKQMKCWESQDIANYKCQTFVDATVEACGHNIRVYCYRAPIDIEFQCTAPCGTILDCGHTCQGRCWDCKTKQAGKITSVAHQVCTIRCGRPYSKCSHSCDAACHGDEPCQLCNQPCAVKCDHSKCDKKCCEPCVPCVEACTWSCPHQGHCALPCAVPCDMLPCSRRCEKILSCGHQCPSICGEHCPEKKFCQTCGDDTIKEQMVDFILGATYGEIDLNESPCIFPQCGHIATTESMDGQMSMRDFFHVDEESRPVSLKPDQGPFSAEALKVCAMCRGSLGDIRRYGRIVKRAWIDEASKKFLVWANAKFVPLTKQMDTVEAEMDVLRESEAEPDKPTTTARSQSWQLDPTLPSPCPREHLMHAARAFLRHEGVKFNKLLGLHKTILRFVHKVRIEEQPFSKVYELVIDSRHRKGIEAETEYKPEILQTRHFMLAMNLFIRCEYQLLLCVFERLSLPKDQKPLRLDPLRTTCEQMAKQALLKKQPRYEAEARTFWARFAFLERRFCSAPLGTDSTSLLDEADRQLLLAKCLCKEFPAQTRGLGSEIELVEKMLHSSDTFYAPVSNAEKAAVYAAMATEFRGTGHWHYCVNGHPFTIGECGMPMETSRCPQCGEPVGGAHHTAVEGVTRADDIEREFGRMGI